MELSLWPTTSQPWPDLLDAVRHAEATGWHAAYVADHFMGDGAAFGAESAPWLEATAVLAALAGATARIRLGSLVLSATYRHPAVVANWAATVDHASGGRLTLGVGAGWQENEHHQYGLALGPPGQRIRRLDEHLTVVRSLLDRPSTSFAGEWFQLDGALCEPKPLQRPLPVLVGGKGDRMLGLVARHADAWNMWSLPPAMRARSEVLARRCEEIGRDPATLRRTTQARVLVTGDRHRANAFVDALAPRAAVAGPPSAFAEVAAEWAAAGVDEVIVPDWDLGTGAERADRLDALHDAVAGLCP